MAKRTLAFILILALAVAAFYMAPVFASGGDVLDQVPESEAGATPIVDEDGHELAFEVKEDERPLPSAGTVMIVIIFGVCLFFCVEAVFSAIKKYRKKRADMFQNMGKE